MAEEADDPDNSDAAEWKAILVAFKMYKAAYGNLKVPVRFVVPSMPPWPKAAWDMKLGQKVSQIRTTGKYVNNNPRRRKTLEKMGFTWRARAESPRGSTGGTNTVTMEQLVDALTTYRDELKPDAPFTVPIDFIVPQQEPWPVNTRGLPLGNKLSNISTAAFQKEYPGAVQQFASLGLQVSKKDAANDLRFKRVYEALKRYKEIYGDLLIPQPFVVPSNTDDWPEDTWGLRIGARVNAIRSQGTFIKNHPERRQLLDDLGFLWSPPQATRGRKAASERDDESARSEATAAAQESVGGGEGEIPGFDTLFGANFDLDADPSSPDAATNLSPKWGLDGNVNPEELAPQAPTSPPEDEYTPPPLLNETLAKMAKTAEEFGIIEKRVEGDDVRVVKGKRSKTVPWFNDDFGGDWVFEDVVEALTLYKSFHGDFSNLTHGEFVVPLQTIDSEMNEFDEFDYELDFDLDASERAAAALSRFDSSEASMAEDVVEADPLQTVDVANSDKADGTWPEHLGEMPLGNIFTRIRDGSLEVKHLPERKAKLDEIDFDWGDPKHFLDVPFEKAMCAMYAYYLVRGDMFVEEDFVMPDEEPWPEALAGYEIGKAVKRVRELQNFLEAYHVEKVGLLRMVDFIWFPSLAHPIDPNESEMTPEFLQLTAMGHPDYAHMRDIPMGLPEKIIADGPYFDTDDPKLWWRRWHNWDYVKDHWYELGRRDNAFVLRVNGYPQMAREHEEKYGPGLFQQIEETLKELEDDTVKRDAEQKAAMLEKLKYFRAEMIGCTDLNFEALDKILEDIDTQLLTLMTGKKGGSVNDQLEAALGPNYQMREGDEDEEVDYEYEYEYEEEEEEEGSSEPAAANGEDVDEDEEEEQEDVDDFDINASLRLR